MRLHSWLSPKCHVAKSPLDGWGVFATDKISEGELLAVWGGVVYTAAELESIGAAFTQFRTHPIEVADGFFLASTSLTAIDDAERFNHGCEPNVGVQGQLLVVARRAIRENEELVFDYETTCESMTPFHCVCGAATCRGIIDGRAASSPEFLQANARWLSFHISQRVAHRD